MAADYLQGDPSDPTQRPLSSFRLVPQRSSRPYHRHSTVGPTRVSHFARLARLLSPTQDLDLAEQTDQDIFAALIRTLLDEPDELGHELILVSSLKERLGQPSDGQS